MLTTRRIIDLNYTPSVVAPSRLKVRTEHVFPFPDRPNIKIIQKQKETHKNLKFPSIIERKHIDLESQIKYKSKSKQSIMSSSFFDVGVSVLEQASTHKHGLDLIKGLKSHDINHIWRSMSIYIRNQIENSKMVHIAGLGTFGLYEQRNKLSNQIFKREKFPFFLVDLNFVKLHNLSYSTKPMARVSSTVSLNYEIIAKLAGFSRDIVQRCIDYSLIAISRHIRINDNIIIQLPELGTLTVLNYNNSNTSKPHTSGDKLIQMIFNNEVSKKIIEFCA